MELDKIDEEAPILTQVGGALASGSASGSDVGSDDDPELSADMAARLNSVGRAVTSTDDDATLHDVFDALDADGDGHLSHARVPAPRSKKGRRCFSTSQPTANNARPFCKPL